MMDTHKIMIVDDDPHICEIVQAYCEREGFISSYSHSGTEAMKLLASFEPDLIVLDVCWLMKTALIGAGTHAATRMRRSCF